MGNDFLVNDRNPLPWIIVCQLNIMLLEPFVVLQIILVFNGLLLTDVSTPSVRAGIILTTYHMKFSVGGLCPLPFMIGAITIWQ